MMPRHAVLWMTSALSLAALAGCATPEESTDPVVTDPDLPGLPLPDVDDTDTTPPPDPDPEPDTVEESTSATPEHIMVGARVYECDDTLDGDGICDQYVLTDDMMDDGMMDDGTMGDDTRSMMQVQPMADGSIEVGGHVFTCEMMEDGDTGMCASYQRPGTIE